MTARLAQSSLRRKLAGMTLSALSWAGVGAALLPTLAAPVCAIQGRDGTTFSGDTYYPGVSSTANTVTIGAARSDANADAAPIAVGDLVFIVQMQDATINTSNSGSYGDGSTGRGQTALGSSGRYEFARVSAVSGSTLTLSQNLTYSYAHAGATATAGQRRFQVIRVPQNSSLAASGLTKTAPPAWNGSTGGVLVLDVAGNLDMAGVTLDASALGFRGGGGVQSSSDTSGRSDYAGNFQGVNQANVGAFKGEGIAGTPRYVRGTGGGFNGVDLTTSGYPNSLDMARGAPGNAGGGGTQHNAGGGGGSNAGAGGKGGYTYGTYSATNTGTCSPLTSGTTTYYSCGGDSSRDMGGLGGGTVTPTGYRMIMGGGGGAGDTNNSDDNPATPQNSGGTGGGLIFVRAQTISGSGILRANGQAGLPAGRDGAGGGGAGGTIAVVTSTASLNLTVEAKGGAGGNSGKTLSDNETQGPGGGGGGGALLLSSGTSVSGFSAATALAGGVAGVNTVTGSNLTNNYGSMAGAGQTSVINFNGSTTVGLPSECRPVLTVTKSTSTPTRQSIIDTTATYTITVTNTGGGAAGVNIADPLPAPFTYTATAITPTYTGGAGSLNTVTGASTIGGGVTTVAFGAAGGTSADSFTLPPSSSVSLTFTVNLASAAGATYQNPANVNFLDPTRTAGKPTVSPGGTYAAGGGVGGSNYAANSTTNEDVTVKDSRLTVTKTFSPTSIQAGNTTTLTLTVTNPNPSAVSALSITDNVATSMGFPTPLTLRVTTNTCGGTTSASENATGVLSLTDGTIAANASCTVTVAFTPWGPPLGTATNTISAANVTGTVGGSAITAAAPASAQLTVTAGNAGGTYVCDPNFYQTRQDPTTGLSNLYLLDLGNLSSGGVPQWTEGFGPALNAMGYNPKDGYFYAVNITAFTTGAPFRLYRLGKQGAVEYASLTSIPAGSSIAAATVDRNGMMYIKKLQQDAVVYRYDLATGAPAPNLALSASVTLWDLAVNPTDNKLYGAVTPGALYIIDPATGTVTTRGAPAALSTGAANAIGTLFFNQKGELYAYQNGGAFGTIDLTSGAFIQTATASAATQSDGGSCAFSSAPRITLTKLGRNISTNPAGTFIGSAGSIGVRPGETVEYCVVYSNTGGQAPNFVLKDYLPVGMVIVPDAYNTGKGIRYAAGVAAVVGGSAAPAGTDLTNISDTDVGTLDSNPPPNPSDPAGGPKRPGLMTLNLGAAGVPAGGTGTVCFQAKVP